MYELFFENRMPVSAFNSSSRTSFSSGTFRACPPEDTLARVLPLASDFGITRVAPVTGLDRVGIPVVMVCRPAGWSLSVSQGKGPTLELAKASGVMEAVEQHCAERPKVPQRWACLADLNPAEQMSAQGLAALGESFTPEKKLLWALGRELRGGAPKWVPHELVHLDFRLPLPPGSGVFPLSSNGLASGNTLEEALVHGLYELVERLALVDFYCASAASRARMKLSLDSIADPSCRALLDRFQDAEVSVGLWSIPAAGGVPTFHCSVVDPASNWVWMTGHHVGHGSHCSAEIALSRALCEAAQARLTAIVGTRDMYTKASHQSRFDEGQLCAQRLELEGDGSVVLPQVVGAFADFAEEQDWLTEAIAQATGYEPLWVDLTPAGAPFHVVRVIAPGAVSTPFPAGGASPRAVEGTLQ